MPHRHAIRPVTQEQTYRTNQDSLAGAGLPSQDVQARLEINFDVVYQREVGNT
jgi:hypothetical protein